MASYSASQPADAGSPKLIPKFPKNPATAPASGPSGPPFKTAAVASTHGQEFGDSSKQACRLKTNSQMPAEYAKTPYAADQFDPLSHSCTYSVTRRTYGGKPFGHSESATAKNFHSGTPSPPSTVVASSPPRKVPVPSGSAGSPAATTTWLTMAEGVHSQEQGLLLSDGQAAQTPPADSQAALKAKDLSINPSLQQQPRQQSALEAGRPCLKSTSSPTSVIFSMSARRTCLLSTTSGRRWRRARGSESGCWQSRAAKTGQILGC